MPPITSPAGFTYPDVDVLRLQVTKVTDRETRGFFWGNYPAFPSPEGLKAWALETEAEHFRAALMGVNPDETDWPSDHAQVLADLEKIADDFQKELEGKAGGYGGVPSYRP